MPILLLLVLLPISLQAQSLRGGIAFSDIYSAPFISPQQSQLQPALGLHFRLSTLQDTLWILEYEVGFQEKGYATYIDVAGERQDYQLNFPYFYQQVMISRQLAPQLDAYGGLGINVLLWPTLRTASDTIRMRDTYSSVDLSLLAGLRLFPAARLSLDLRATSSIFPILRYEVFDDFGNPAGSKRGIRHLTVEAALMLNIYKNRKTMF
jgi:hypothetical protein